MVKRWIVWVLTWLFHKVKLGRGSYVNSVEKILQADPDSLVIVLSNRTAAKVSNRARKMGYQDSLIFTQEPANSEFLKILGLSYSIIEGMPELSLGNLQAPLSGKILN